MIKLFHFLVDRTLFALGLAVGSQVPAYTSQYRQHIGGRLEQIKMDLNLFRQIADQFFDGNMQKLLEHHLNSSDPAFQAEGRAIDEMLQQEQLLMQVYEAMQTHVAGQLWVMYQHWDQAGVVAAWQNFQPAIIYSADAIVLTLLAGFIVVLLYHGLVYLLAAGKAGIMRRMPRARH